MFRVKRELEMIKINTRSPNTTITTITATSSSSSTTTTIMSKINLSANDWKLVRDAFAANMSTGHILNINTSIESTLSSSIFSGLL